MASTATMAAHTRPDDPDDPFAADFVCLAPFLLGVFFGLSPPLLGTGFDILPVLTLLFAQVRSGLADTDRPR